MLHLTRKNIIMGCPRENTLEVAGCQGQPDYSCLRQDIE